MDQSQRSRLRPSGRPHLHPQSSPLQSPRYSSSPPRKDQHHALVVDSSPSFPAFGARIRQMKEEQLSYTRSSKMGSQEPRSRNANTTASPLVSSASPFLQHLINEQRAARGGRGASSTCDRASDNSSRPQSPVTTQSQDDLSSEKQRKIANALSAGLKQPGEMGVREMDQYVHKLNKLTFDLKLEIFHRAQQMAIMKKKLERMQELEDQVRQMERMQEELEELREVEENNRRLRESNEQLQLELDKRDQAITEAVDLICQLEARIEELESDIDTVQTAITPPDASDTAATSSEPSLKSLAPKSKVVLDIPDRTSSRRGTRSTSSQQSRVATPSGPGRARRQPSFLQDQNENTRALRSVYSRRALSTKSRSDTMVSGEDERQCPDSPNLSILSECSYFEPRLDLARPTILDEPPRTLPRLSSPKDESSSETNAPIRAAGKLQAISRVEQWMQPQGEDAAVHTPIQLSPSATLQKKDRETKPQLGPAFRVDRPKQRMPTLDAPYGNGRFPPTPDTMSTSQANTQDPTNLTVIVEKSRYDHLYAPFTLGTGLRKPRSADDITTRPSTSTTTTDGFEHESSHHEFGVDDDCRLASIFPSYDHTKLVPSNCISHKKTRGGQSDDVNSSKPQASTSPPLTPEDWLAAALPAPVSKQGTAGKIARSETPTPHPTTQVRTPSKRPPSANGYSPDTHEFDLPPPGALRVRNADASPNAHPVPGSKRVLNFRLFGRAVTVSHQPISTLGPIDNDKNFNRIGRRHSTSRRHSAHIMAPSDDSRQAVDGTVAAGDKNSNAAPSTSPDDDNTTNRPTTAGSLEFAKRLSSNGFFGWIRGSLGKDAEQHHNHLNPASGASPAPAPLVRASSHRDARTRVQREKESQHQSIRPASVFAQTGIDIGTDAVSPMTLGTDEGRKSKFSSRRFRKGKEVPGICK
ncbi:hypothetical protein VTO42DRAFT_5521 [Malbranchea cinnamomea]